MDRSAFAAAAKRGLARGTPLQDPLEVARVTTGMAVATAVAYLVADHPAQQMMLLLGALLGTFAAVIPAERSRPATAGTSSFCFLLAALAGGLVHGTTWIVLLVIAAGFFCAGMALAISVGMSIRWVVGLIAFLAVAEMAPHSPIPTAQSVGYIGAGFVIMFLAQLLPPYGPRYRPQRQKVAALYRALSPGSVAMGAALTAADRSLVLVHSRRHPQVSVLRQLTVRAEEIMQLLIALDGVDADENARWIAAAQTQLRAIADVVSTAHPRSDVAEPEWPGPPPGPVHRGLIRTVTSATALAAGDEVPDTTDPRLVPTGWDLVRDQLHPSSHIFRHAIRLSITCVFAQLIGMAISAALGPRLVLPGHSFWVVIAAAMILFPDFGSTFSRGAGRLIGTLLGAPVGIALTLLPLPPAVHLLLLLALYCGYVAYRTAGQVYSMLFLVAYISCLIPTPLSATTRAGATTLGSLIAFAAYLLLPTWERRLLTERLRYWLRAVADQLDAQAATWSDDSAAHRSAAARHTVRARLARLDFVASARNALLEPADRSGRWPPGLIVPVVASVAELARQVAILTAMSRGWTPDVGSAALAHARPMSSRLRDLAAAPPAAGPPLGQPPPPAPEHPVPPTRPAAPGAGLPEIPTPYTRAAVARAEATVDELQQLLAEIDALDDAATHT